MIKPEQIPKEMVAAFRDAWMDADKTTEAAIAAALNAWPNAQQRVFPAYNMETGHYEVPALILWLFPPEEKNDD